MKECLEELEGNGNGNRSDTGEVRKHQYFVCLFEIVSAALHFLD